jgi:glycosyltransferase involved in cell wall biosynthesis
VLAQDVDLEVVVVDEASRDGTSAMLAAWDDPRIQVVHHERPMGVARARNAGIEQARAEAIAFLDDDDLWFQGKLRLQLEAMATEGTDWAYCGAIIFSPGPRLEAVVPPPAAAATVARLPYVNTVPGGGSNVLVTRRALDSVGTLALDLPSIEDWDLSIRLSRFSPPAVVDELLIAYRRHGGNMSRTVEQTLSSAAELDRRYQSIRNGEPIDWADLLHWTSSDALRAGDRRTALRISIRALRQRHPASFKRLLQSLSPIPRRSPIPEPREPTNLYERVRPPRVVPWPPGIEEQLQALLKVNDNQ